METRNTHLLTVLFSTMLFLTFSMMHEFNWLIPDNPAAVVTNASQVPLPDAVEEHGSEDEIEHEDYYEILNTSNSDFLTHSMDLNNMFIPAVPLPPPDMT